jgi:cellulose synthase/poly-beta-1,6-N-acetylglucosamine synthase-like glycosyltransferase
MTTTYEEAVVTIPDDSSEHDIAHRYKVVALVPAYNEGETIEKSLRSLLNQTFPFDCVYVNANNCSPDDTTIETVKKLRREYGKDKLRLVVMNDNKHKKSGALNYLFNMLDHDVDIIFSMDSDTIIDEKMVEEGVLQFAEEPETGGICSAYRTLPLKKDATRWERFMWRIQNIEFGLANAWRLEHRTSARVLPGVSVIYRMSALREVAALQKLIEEHKSAQVDLHGEKSLTRKVVRRIDEIALSEVMEMKKTPGGIESFLSTKENLTVWAVNHLVEDYRLTLDLKDLGWKCKSSHEMISWSDVPLKLRGKAGLWDQRQRWYSGTVDELRSRRLKKHSRYELFTISLMMVNILMRLLLVGAYVTLLVEGKSIQVVSIFLLLPVFAAISQTFRWTYADQKDKWQFLMTVTLVVNELYAFYRELIYAYAIWVSYCRPDRDW